MLHNIVFVSAVQCESASRLYTYIPSLLSFSPTTPTRPSMSSEHLAELTALYHSFPLASYFTLVVYIYMAMLLSQFVTLTTFSYCSHKSVLYKSRLDATKQSLNRVGVVRPKGLFHSCQGSAHLLPTHTIPDQFLF